MFAEHKLGKLEMNNHKLKNSNWKFFLEQF